MSTLSKVLIYFIRSYQRYISPLLPARCRYYPTCSSYGITAIRWHGAWRGSKLALNRVCRCHPWGGHGFDFVPLPFYRYQFQLCDGCVSHGSVSRETDHETRVRRCYVYRDRTSYRALLNQQLR